MFAEVCMEKEVLKGKIVFALIIFALFVFILSLVTGNANTCEHPVTGFVGGKYVYLCQQ